MRSDRLLQQETSSRSIGSQPPHDMHMRWDCLYAMAIYTHDSSSVDVQLTAHDLICCMLVLYTPQAHDLTATATTTPAVLIWVGSGSQSSMITALLVCGFIIHTAVLSPSACNKQRASETLYIVTDKIAKSEPRPGVAHLGERGIRQK